jgi:O-acetylhomoserine/O-acetylserine sulfhydrylase-like pyridoxal-dependent enzyme
MKRPSSAASSARAPLAFTTRAVHAGEASAEHPGVLATPTCPGEAHRFKGAEEGAAIHEGGRPGYFRARIANPAQAALEAAMADLERSEAALATDLREEASDIIDDLDRALAFI